MKKIICWIFGHKVGNLTPEQMCWYVPCKRCDKLVVIEKSLNEEILENYYPVFWDCLYVADARVIRSKISGTIFDLKRNLESQGISAKIITSCDIEGRRKMKDEI